MYSLCTFNYCRAVVCNLQQFIYFYIYRKLCKIVRTPFAGLGSPKHGRPQTPELVLEPAASERKSPCAQRLMQMHSVDA